MKRLSIAAVSAVLTAAPAYAADGSFHLATLDVGQGDATVVVAPSGCAALFDGGPTGSGATIRAWLRARGISRLDYVVLSHYHADHVGGLDEIETGTDAVVVDTVLDNGGSYSTIAFQEYAARYADRRVVAAPGQVWSLCGEVRLEVLLANANGIATSDENARSVAVKITDGQIDALVAGDLTAGGALDMEAKLAPLAGEVEIYKVHHHGARTSTGQALVDALRPQNAFFSLGWNNSYGHPAPEVVSRLAAAGAALWLTEDPAQQKKLGHIHAVSPDGLRYTVTQGARTQAFVAKDADVVPPSAPEWIVAQSSSSSSIDVSWAPAQDDRELAGYRLQWSADGQVWHPLATTTSASFADTGLPWDTTLWYRVSAFDAWGNESGFAGPASATTVDTQAPAAPAALSAVAGPATIELSWSESTDDVWVAGYTLYRDGVRLASPSGLAYADAAVGPSETHVYEVSARDPAGNESARSAPASATTACRVDIPVKTFNASTGYLYVRATGAAAGSTLTASVDGRLLGTMSWASASGYWYISRRTGTQPACVTVAASCGGTATSCF